MLLVSIQLLLSVIVASATVSTAVATGVTLWLRFRERPEPDWVVTTTVHRYTDADFGNGEPRLEAWGALSNVGDGSAFRVSLAPLESKGSFQIRTGSNLIPRQNIRHVALMGPGDEASFVLSAGPDNFDKVSFTVEWTVSPTRKGKRRKQTFRLADIAERPAEPETKDSAAE